MQNGLYYFLREVVFFFKQIHLIEELSLFLKGHIITYLVCHRCNNNTGSGQKKKKNNGSNIPEVYLVCLPRGHLSSLFLLST